MNMVVCRHPGDSGKYIFKVPDSVELDAGVLVKVETARGEQPAQTLTGTFRADPKVICPMWGTQPSKMKRVISFLHESLLEWPDEPDIQEQAFVDEDDEP